MEESTVKRHERLGSLQRTNIDSWGGRQQKLDPKTLDSSMKKNTGFIKKCKAGLGQDSAAQLVREVRLLRLEKYVSEIVPAAFEGLAKCKATGDVSAAVDVLTALHARFPVQTTVPLVGQVLRALAPPTVAALAAMAADTREREEQARLGRQRVLLRMLAEMHLAGLLWGIDASPNAVDGMDRAAAFMLAHPAQPAGGTAAAGKLAARVKEAVQQPGYCVLVGALQNLLLVDREHHLSIILAASFARTFKTDYALAGDEALAASACSVRAGDDPVVDADTCQKLRGLLNEYLDSAIAHLQTMHKALVRMRRNAEEKLFSKGVVYAEIKEKLEKHTKAFEKLSESVGLLCEPLGRTPPDLADSVEGESQMDIVFDAPGVAKGGQLGIWEDDEERAFYEALPDFRAKLPPSMLTSQRKKQKSQDAAGASSSSPSSPAKPGDTNDEGDADEPPESSGLAEDAVFEDIDESAIDADVQSPPIEASDELGDEDAPDSATALGLLEYQKFMSRRRRNDAADAEITDTLDHAGDSDDIAADSIATQPLLSRSVSAAATATAAATAAAEDNVQTPTQPLSAGGASQTIESRDLAEVLRRMPLFTNRDDVDQAALDFCCVNNRANRALLVRALMDVPRRQLFLVPYYARMVAVLHPYFPEISEAVVDELSQEFRWLVRQRFKDLMDTRIKNCRYLAELTKFKVAPLHVIYRCAKVLVEQLHAQNIEVLCALLEGCGRFLLAQSATAERVASLLDILTRKCRVLNLDDRTALLIENACRACRPQQSGLSQHVKLRTPIEQYIRKLIYEDLSRDSADRVCQKLRRLPWNDLSACSDDPQRIRRALLSCFAKPWKIKHANVYLLTMIAGALCRLHPWFRMVLVDTVLENIKVGLERSMFAHNQRRMAEMRYVGEMLIFRIVGSGEIIELLYLIMRHGHTAPHPVPGRACAIDQADDYFRVRLACTLMQACGSYMRETSERAALERFALYLQMYVLAKDQPVPIDTEYCVDSLFETVFPSLVRYETWQEAAQAMSDLVQGKTPVAAASAAAASGGEADSTSSGYGPDGAADGLERPLEPGMPIGIAGKDYVGSDAIDADADGGSQDVSEDEETDPELEELLLQQRKEAEEAEMAEAKLQIEAVEALIEQEEEDILETEFNRLLVDSSDPRKVDRASKLDVAIPMNLLGRSSAAQMSNTMFGLGSPTTPLSASNLVSHPDSEDPVSPAADSDAIRFSLLTGKRQRPVVRAVHIPVESQIARNLRLQEEEAMRERAQLKRIVLDYERREAAEEMRAYEAARAKALGPPSARAGANAARFDGVYRRRVVPGATFVNRPATNAPRRRNIAGSAVSPGGNNTLGAGPAQQKPSGN
ncbi:mRNA decay protein [Coemansia erecta]|uniref:mRNA decay protein n=1 Tax=Coemansia erecta TaxID=147472 RepID=A0A9W7Y4L6_9FUNG|nr:mRNA decay protein [Coemansia erecta]